MKKVSLSILLVLFILVTNIGNSFVFAVEDTVNLVSYDYKTKEESYFAVSNEINNNKAIDELKENITYAYCPNSLSQEYNTNYYRTIIGEDNRKKVNPELFPYSAITFLYLGQDTNGDGKTDSWGYGTGFMVGERVMLTAAHCYWSKQHGWIEECRTYVKQNSSKLGSTYYYPSSWNCPTNYTNNVDYRYDWCVVKMSNPIGKQTGCLGYGTGGSMLNKKLTTSGYPGDDLGIQKMCTGKASYEDSYICKFNMDSIAGQSGSPIYDSDYIVWAILTYEGDGFNQGNKLTAACCNAINEAKK